MRFKKLTAVLLSAATLAAMPNVPMLRKALPATTVIAEAADTVVTQFTVNKVKYIVYKNSSGQQYACVKGADETAVRIKLSANVTYNNVSYPIRKIKASAFENKSNLVEMNLSEASYLREIGNNAFKGSGIKYVELSGQNLTIRKDAFRDTRSLDYVYAYSSITSLTVEANAFTNSAIRDFSCYAKKLTLKPQSFEAAAFGSNLHFYIYSSTDTADIQTQAFWGAWLTYLNINSRNTFIRKNAFLDSNNQQNCATIETVNFNYDTQSIVLEESSFSDLHTLQTVCFNNPSVQLTLGEKAFSCSYIESINLPSTTKKIPAECFSGCRYLTNFSMPKSLKTIGTGAFQYANLPETVSISKNTTSIANNAFTYTQGVKSFSVAEDNPNYKSKNGVLLSKDETVLLCYPQKKTATTYTATAATIPDGAFNCNKSLKTLSISNLFRGGSDIVSFEGLSNLENLTIPQMDYNSNAELILRKFRSLFESTKVHKLNSSEIVVVKNDQKPYFNAKFSTYMKNHFEDYEQYGFMKRFVDKTAEYVVNSVTTSTMTDMQKAVKLHDWIINNVEYDPLVADADAMKARGITPPDTMYSGKNNVDASVFLHERNGHHYTVCDGYARCYRILMNKAGIKTYYVHGADKEKDPDKRIDHAWNLVQINGNFYHVDVCWDDGNTGTDRFNSFMMSDANFASSSNGHSKYNWNVITIGTLYDPDEEINMLNNVNGVAKLTMGDLGRVKPYTSIDKYSVKRLQELVAGAVPNDYERMAGDIDFDGNLTSKDVTLLKRYINYYQSSGISVAEWQFENLS